MDNKKIRILIADGESVFRLGLKALLEKKPEFEVVGEACDGNELLEKALECKPDIIIINIKMPVLDGITAARELIKNKPDSRIIGMSSFLKDDFILNMMELGAMGYLAKTAEADEIAEAISTVYESKPYFCRETTVRLTDIVSRNYKLPAKANAVFTNREQEIMRLICKEFTSREIALNLHLSKRTVEGHRTRIMTKIGAKSIAGIITYSVQYGIHKK